jgi:hypothetical protein
LVVHLLVIYVEQGVDALYGYDGTFVLQTCPRDVDMYLFDVTKLEGERQTQLVYECRLQGHVFNRHLAIQQSYIETVLESVNILTQVFDQHALNDIFHWDGVYNWSD